MTLVGKRAELAAALNTIDGVIGYEYRPTTPRPGDAWPLLGPMERDEGRAFIVTWRVFVFLPQDERAASDWIDAHFDAVVDGLSPVVFVDKGEPFLIPAAGSEQFCLMISTRSE